MHAGEVRHSWDEAASWFRSGANAGARAQLEVDAAEGDRLAAAWERRDYTESLALVARELKEPIDRFFDDVLVMADDEDDDEDGGGGN